MRQVQIKAEIINDSMLTKINGCGIFNKQEESLKWQDTTTNTNYNINLTTNEFVKEDNETILFLNFSKNEKTNNKLTLKENNKTIDLIILTEEITVKDNEYQVIYRVLDNQNSNNQITFSVNWE